MDRLRKDTEIEIVSINHNVGITWENSGDKLVGHIKETLGSISQELSARAKISATDLTNHTEETDKDIEAVRQQVKEQMISEVPIWIKMVSEQVVGEQQGENLPETLKINQEIDNSNQALCSRTRQAVHVLRIIEVRSCNRYSGRVIIILYCECVCVCVRVCSREHVSVCARAHECVRVCASVRVLVYVCMCEWVCASECVWESESECAWVWVSVRECVWVCVSESVIECVWALVCECVRARVWEFVCVCEWVCVCVET